MYAIRSYYENSVTDYDVLLYSDAAHTDLVASGDLLDAAQGTVVLSGSANYRNNFV